MPVTTKDLLHIFLRVFFEYDIQLKMFHFQTKQYGAHKASDAYLSTIRDKSDKFMEVAQGIYGRVESPRFDISVIMATDGDISKCIDKFIETMNKLSEHYKDHTELINIKDEIVADSRQFKYLLTFR